MDAHFVGQSQFSGGEESPTPSTYEISLVVCQFMELARGERSVVMPRNSFRVEAVKAEEFYCLRCCEVHWFDVIEFQERGSRRLAVCRSCREEVWR